MRYLRITIMPCPAATEDSRHLKGTGASRGIAFGRICFLRHKPRTPRKYQIKNPDQECERLERARQHAITQLGALYEASLEKLGEQNAAIFQIHQMMLDDPDYVQAINLMIRTQKVNAEYAVDIVGKRFEQQFINSDSDYMQGRAADVIDISRRLTEILMMHAGSLKHKSSPLHGKKGPLLIATDDLAPSETVQLDPANISGILTSGGSERSHTVIFARAMGIPAVICLGDKLIPELENHEAIIDGLSGEVIIDPLPTERRDYRERKLTADAQNAHLEDFRGRPTLTRGGRKIALYANAGSLGDLELVRAADAEGIGLFRSEYLFLCEQDYPTEERQFEIYRDLLSGMEGKKVIIRTLDIGADKTPDYFMLKHEDNPAMGLRAVRLCLERPALFKTQLRALYRASVYGKLAIMLPMISVPEELKRIKKICAEVRASLRRHNVKIADHIEFGIMVETPSAALLSDLFAPQVDFFSIGTNDLTQFTLAADRQNGALGGYFEGDLRAVLRLVELTVKNAHQCGIWAGVCGEMAADERYLPKLVQLGVDELSVVPSALLRTRARIATLG